MPASTTDTGDKPRPINRWGVGTLSLVQIASLLVIFVAVNYLGAIRYQRIDLSRTGDFTLSNVSKRLLAQ